MTISLLSVKLSNSFCGVSFAATDVHIKSWSGNMNQRTSPVVWLEDDTHTSPPQPPIQTLNGLKSPSSKININFANILEALMIIRLYFGIKICQALSMVPNMQQVGDNKFEWAD